MKSLIQTIAKQQSDTQKPVEYMEAEVIQAPPDLKIRLKGNDKLIIPKELIVLSEYVTNHRRQIKLTGKLDFSGGTAGGNTRTENIVSVSLDKGDAFFDGEIEFMNELQEGEIIIVSRLQGGQKFIILDRQRTY
ncbi:DUF2577 domain-containing protein [Sporosarcina sp. Marseille-Q4943]|uniref:DUF2577 domain-containing protein n=1 Tax=Sporosarcina sp. Marseille-Q4943 TaxID=2942204 RepID=UPI00208DCD74|nr:DUF2577 domain-containing protein [Sporosarcina sp. Marseille-Q4943]